GSAQRARNHAAVGLVFRLFSLHGSIADIPAILHAFPANLVTERIGGLLRVADGLAEPDGAQHAAAIGDDLAVVQRSAGVEHLARQRGRVVEAMNLVAFAHRFRIAARSQHDSERRARVPFGSYSI